MITIASEKSILESAEQSLKDILSNPDEVTSGNGVALDGAMYPDTRLGLKFALLVIQELKGNQK